MSTFSYDPEDIKSVTIGRPMGRQRLTIDGKEMDVENLWFEVQMDDTSPHGGHRAFVKAHFYVDYIKIEGNESQIVFGSPDG